MDESEIKGPDSQEHRKDETTNWVIGVLLILVGVAFLLQNAGYFVLSGNWWAIFIYAVALVNFVKAWRAYRAEPKGFSATGSLIWGFVLTVVATILALNLEWDQWWPAILIGVGAGIVIGRMLEARGGVK
jgi:hypothetical protein